MSTSSLHQLEHFSKKTVMRLQILLLLLGVFLCNTVGFAQGLISQIEVKSFSRNEYEAGTQNWAITQDSKNRLYVANNEGLLVYNGTNWQRYPMPNKTILRSIGFGVDGKLYAGAQDELGYFSADKVGRLQFTSLKSLLPAQDRTFDDVWQLKIKGKDIFFRTNKKIFKFNGEKFAIYPTKSDWIALHTYQGQILAHDRELGLLLYQNNQWQTFITKDALPPGFLITDVINYKNGTSLLSTVNNGLYLLTEKNLKVFDLNSAEINTKQHFTSLSLLDNGDFIVGTYFNGIYRISSQGFVVEHISAKNGMRNNTVRCLFTDTNNDVWVGLDNGMAFFTHDEAIKLISPPVFNKGAGYDVKVLGDNLYFALSTGLLRLPLKSNPNLSKISQEPEIMIKGLTWNLSIIDNQLLAGRDDGLYAIEKEQVRLISSSTGYWACQAVPNTSPPRVIAGNYFGVSSFNIDDEEFVKTDILEDFKESSRYIETDEKSVWVSHPYRGVYRIMLSDKSIRLFSQKEGLPADLDNHVFKIKGKVVFATLQGIYEYNATKDSILKSKTYANIFSEKPIRYLKEDQKGNIWFIQDKMLGVVDFNTRKPVMHYIPELRNKIVSGFENIFPYNHRNVLIGSESGFYHLNYEKYLEKIKPFSAYISEIQTSGIIDSVLFGGYNTDISSTKSNTTIPYHLNSLLFSYSASIYGQLAGVEYSYYLEGFDSDWSTWTENTEKEYTNLPAGTYTFKVKARKSPSHESSVYEFTFSVTPPWYQTVWAYLLYLLLFAIFLRSVLRYQAQKQRKKTRRKTIGRFKKI